MSGDITAADVLSQGSCDLLSEVGWKVFPCAMLLTYGGDGITVDHNTVFTDGTSVVFADGPAALGVSFTNNIVPGNIWAIKGSGTAAGNGTITQHYPCSIFRRNVFTAGHAATYPTDNFFPANVAAVGFADIAGGNYQLTAASPYLTSATDGSPVGADVYLRDLRDLCVKTVSAFSSRHRNVLTPSAD